MDEPLWYDEGTQQAICSEIEMHRMCAETWQKHKFLFYDMLSCVKGVHTVFVARLTRVNAV